MTDQRTRWRWRLRRWGLPIIDAALLFVGLALASAGRYDGDVQQIDVEGLFLIGAVTATAYALTSSAMRLHQGRHSVGSVEELTTLGVAIAVTSLSSFAVAVVG